MAGAKEVLTAWPDVDAIVCGDDLIAIGALRALGDLRIPVPNRIAVVGFDDCTYAPMNRPTLTTIRQPLEQMARQALSLLLRPQSLVHPQSSALPQSSVHPQSSAQPQSSVHPQSSVQAQSSVIPSPRSNPSPPSKRWSCQVSS